MMIAAPQQRFLPSPLSSFYPSPSTPISPPWYSSLRAFDQSSLTGIKNDSTPRYVPTYSPRLSSHPSSRSAFAPAQSPRPFFLTRPPPADHPTPSTHVYASVMMTRGNTSVGTLDLGAFDYSRDTPFTPGPDVALDCHLEDGSSIVSNDLSGHTSDFPVASGYDAVNGPYSCSYPLCSWSSFIGDELISHLHSHQSMRRYECYEEGCGSSFVFPGELSAHLSNHSSGGCHKIAAEFSGSQELDYAQYPVHFLATPELTPNRSSSSEPSSFVTSASMAISRTLSYGGHPHPPVFARSVSYDGVPSASSTMNSFSHASSNLFGEPYTLSSPLNIIERPDRGTLPNIRIDTSNIVEGDFYNQHPISNRSLSPGCNSYPLSPLSPENYAPSLIPIDVAEDHYYNSEHEYHSSYSQRDSGIPSPCVTPGSYASAQAALRSATELNQMLANLSTPARSPEPDISKRGRRRVKTTRAPSRSYRSDSSDSSNYQDDSKPFTPTRAGKVKSHGTRAIVLADGDEKIHSCSYPGCGKRFKRSEHTRRHEKTHTDEKNYGCDIIGCGRFFSRSDNLTQHKKTHERAGRNTSNVKANQMALLRGLSQSSK